MALFRSKWLARPWTCRTSRCDVQRVLDVQHCGALREGECGGDCGADDGAAPADEGAESADLDVGTTFNPCAPGQAIIHDHSKDDGECEALKRPPHVGRNHVLTPP